MLANMHIRYRCRLIIRQSLGFQLELYVETTLIVDNIILVHSKNLKLSVYLI
jgi:hypothetical protein